MQKYAHSESIDQHKINMILDRSTIYIHVTPTSFQYLLLEKSPGPILWRALT